MAMLILRQTICKIVQYPKGIVTAVLLASLLWPAGAAGVTPARMAALVLPQVRVLPDSGDFPVNDEITVALRVEQVEGLYGADVQLHFDPTRLQVVDADPAHPGVQIVLISDLLTPDLVIHHEADNSLGTIWYAVTQLNPSPARSGSGSLFTFKVQTIAPGPATVQVYRQQLSNRDGEAIPADSFDAAYQILEQTGLSHFLYLPWARR